MNTQEVLVSSKRIIISLVTCFLVIVMVGGGNVICQETKTLTKRTGSDLTIGTYKEIPEAAEPCTPAECEWWKQIREAGNNLLRKGDDKSKKKYVLLFVEGMEKTYRVPLADRPPQLLVSARPTQPAQDIRPKNGKVELSVEVRADGSVGEVKVVKGLRSDMDQHCIQPQRQSIFLPAVKNYAFVTEWQKAACTFWSRKGL